jgi:hypothetical protein
VAKSYRLTFRSLKPIGETKQIVGVAVAVNGKMLSVDIFESTPLFKKFWPKLMKSYALDAVASQSENNKGRASKAVAIKDCIVFLKDLENSKAETQISADGQKMTKRDSKGGISFSYYDAKAASPAEALKEMRPTDTVEAGLAEASIPACSQNKRAPQSSRQAHAPVPVLRPCGPGDRQVNTARAYSRHSYLGDSAETYILGCPHGENPGMPGNHCASRRGDLLLRSAAARLVALAKGNSPNS